MLQVTLSLLELYKYDNSLFDNLALPADIDTSDNREMLIDNLLMECGHFEVLYPDFDLMKSLIGRFSRRKLPVWQHLYETTQYEYNPIHNYDRDENYTETTNIKDDTQSSMQTGTQAGTTSKQTDNTVNKVSGYNNAGGLTDRDSSDYNSGVNTSSNQITASSDNSKYNRAMGNKHLLHAEGNIGVTSTQQMIQQEREVAEFNIFDRIIDDLKKQFCLLVY